MRLPDRRTADRIIHIFCGACIGVGVALTAVAALFGVPLLVSIIVGTIFLLLWVGTLLLWAAT